MDLIFQLSGLLVMPFWVLIIFLPHWDTTRRVVASPLIVLPAALLYVALFATQATTLVPALMNPGLAGIAAILGSPAGATIGWVHFLAFDLFVGRWVYLDARERGISAWLSSPVLLLVLMAGPLGYALHIGIRSLSSKPQATMQPIETA